MPTLIRPAKGHGNRHAARGIRKAKYDRNWTRVIVCASGPSFSAKQALMVRAAQPEWKVIVTNNTWQAVPSADVLYAGDRKWWVVHLPSLREHGMRMGFGGECWTVDRQIAHLEGLHLVEHSDEPGLSAVHGRIHTGGNSGYAAIGLAYLFGAREILLVGFDYQDTYQMAHWHGNHHPDLNQDRPFAGWLQKIPKLIQGLNEHGVRVTNCSTETAIPDEVIPRGDLASCLSPSTERSRPRDALLHLLFGQ